MRGPARPLGACHPITQGFAAVEDAVSIGQERQAGLGLVRCFFGLFKQGNTYAPH